jgi:predicted RNA methylase
MDLHSSIHPAALDLMLSSANNAAQKGQSQYSTPIELAAAIARELPSFRPAIVDLTCGPGQLLAGVANKTTEHLLGCDLDPRASSVSSHPIPSHSAKRMVIHADLTLLYEPMRQIDFRADCFALNPPWSLNWHAVGTRDSRRLEGLADSEVPAVAKTFKAVRQAGDTIDSTLATLMIALDRLSSVGEGFLIGYTSTLERLIFAPGSVGELLVPHIWKRQPLAALPLADPAKPIPEPLQLSTVLYFSAAHDSGPTADGQRPRFMPRINGYNSRPDTVEQWKALAERAQAMLPDAPPRFHLSLRGNQIQVRLGLFDTALTKVNRALAKAAERLSDLDGRNPMQVVMQRDERNFILGLLRPGAEWTVDPALRDAVQAAVGQYNAVRAPLVPLPKIQRLGYLDESSDILCVKNLKQSATCPPVFRAGVRYPLATRSIRFTRTQIKPNLRGEDEELELSGQELAIFIKAEGELAEPELPSEGWCFMDGALRAANVKIGDDPGANVIHFTLQDLVDHFDIPEVPHIATTDPDRYNSFIALLQQLEQITARI